VDLATVLKVVHALFGVWLIAAVVGRWVTLNRAASSNDLGAVHTLLGLSDRFEKWVRLVPNGVLILGIATAIAQNRPFLGPLQGAGIDWLFVSLVLYLSIIPWILLVFLPRGRLFAAALEDADQQGAVTPRLTTAFHDPVVFAGHVYELVILGAVLTLMIAKPF
jgi:hypothetical protein